MPPRSPRITYASVFGLLAVLCGWAVWLHRIGVNDFDDMLSNELQFAAQSLSTIVRHLPWADQSPLFFVVLHWVRLVGESPLALQLVNALLLTATLAATWMLALELAGSAVVAACAVALGALSPTSLWLVRNGRMYSFQVLFTTLAALCAVRYLSRRRPADLAGLGVLSLLDRKSTRLNSSHT